MRRFVYFPVFTVALVGGVSLHGATALAGTFRGIGGTRAEDISADGSTVVGNNNSSFAPGSRAWRWSAADGVRFLPALSDTGIPRAEGVSIDGSFVVGRTLEGANPQTVEAVRWSAAGTLLRLGEGSAMAVSRDGSTIAGWREIWTVGPGGTVNRRGILDDAPFGSTVWTANSNVSVVVGAITGPGGSAFRWTEATGVVRLSPDTRSNGRDVSEDGGVVVGEIVGDRVFGNSPDEAFRWTPGGGMVGLGDLPGGIDFSTASTVSADGSRVGGFGNTDSGPEYFYWDAVNGMRPLADVFREAGLDFSGWTLTAPFNVYSDGPLSMSADGLTFAGTGINPQGQTEAWLATIPEPGGLLLLGLATMGLLRRRGLRDGRGTGARADGSTNLSPRAGRPSARRSDE